MFAAYIEETGSPVSGGKIWTVEYQPLKHPDGSNADDALNLLNKVYIGTTRAHRRRRTGRCQRETGAARSGR